MASERLPDLFSGNIQLKQAWFKLKHAILVLLGLTGMSKVAYVDKTGDDSKAKLGSEAFKFLTIQAALNAIDAAETATPGAGVGFTVQIGAGTYTENVIVPDINGLVFVGAGPDRTIIQNSGAFDTFQITTLVSNTRQEMIVEDLTIQNDQNNANIFAADINGAATLDLFQTGFCEFENVYFRTTASTRAVRLTATNRVLFRDCLFLSAAGVSDLSTVNAASTDLVHCFLGNISSDFSVLLPLPAIAQDGVRLLDTNCQDIVANNQQRIYADKSARVGSITCAFTDEAGGTFGQIEFHGEASDAVLLNFDFDVADRAFFNFDYATIEGTFTVAQGPAALVSTFRGTGRGLHANFDPGSAITVGIRADVDLRYSEFLQADVVCPADANAGTLDRTYWTQNVPAGANPVAVTFVTAGATPCLYPSAAYSVVVEGVFGDAPFGVTGKTTADVDITKGAANASPIDVTIIRP